MKRMKDYGGQAYVTQLSIKYGEKKIFTMRDLFFGEEDSGKDRMSSNG